MNFRLRFSIFDDLCLLREIVNVNPYEDNRRWDQVCKTVVNFTGKNFSIRSLKEHTTHLLKLWHNADKANIRKSGSEEQYREKEQLLQEVNNLVREFKGVRHPERRPSYDVREEIMVYPKTEYNDLTSDLIDLEDGSFYLIKQETEDLQEEESRKEYSSHFESSPVATPPESPNPNVAKKEKMGHLYRDFLLDREKYDKQWRKQQIEIERERLAIKRKEIELQEEKFKLEKEERLAKLEMEKEERQHRMEMDKNQQIFFDKLINMLENKQS
ncbi:hypothetical protein L9F63_013634 [Diploptera punctata]|uniref:Uncharacterized protein n=1 Tax=Diploptera punctata TaxID=6984 RepID=A0AAD8A9R9_DIPPU|nr:hypothetical protein L9F63_013634 [Diploptera punctata]